MKYKQIIIARKDLNMSPGKLSAQVSHASMAFLTWMIRNNVNQWINEDGVHYIAELDFDQGTFENWIDGEFTKCVLKAKNRNNLLKAKTLAEELGMIEGKDFWCIRDNCHTELEPEEVDENGVGRCLTCIGFKPMPEDVIDKIGRKYHLYT